MQVANALNNIIRILFNPKVETFKLFDILLVKSEQDRYLAQIIEIYDDKFDASQNVAKLKLFYKISEQNEVIPYDNFTPNKECEVIRINQKEIETFINNSKKTFPFGMNFTSGETFEIQEELFSNNPVIFADKTDCANEISIAIAKNLSDKKTLIVDFTGVIDFDGADKIKAIKDFRLPLNYFTLDFVFDKFLSDATLEFQSVGNEILKALKRFAASSEDSFIPFNVFTKVIKEQYKATPHAELKLFLSRLERCQLDNIFSKSKNDSKCFNKSLSKDCTTILDLSPLDGFFQKLYFEYLIDSIQDDIYLLVRINDENCDSDLINKIYNKKQNIKFIPNVSFNYKKLPSMLQYCKNYIMFPSLYQRIDFLDINASLSNLISDGCLIFGENTNNFIYFIKDYALKPEEKRRNYRTISLSLAENFKKEPEEDSLIPPSENPLKKAKEKYNPTPDSQKLMKELSIPDSNIEVEEENDVQLEQESTLSEEPSLSEEITVEHNESNYSLNEEENEPEQVQDVEESNDDEQNVEVEEAEAVENQDEKPHEIELSELTDEEKETFDGTFSKELKEIANKDFVSEAPAEIDNEPDEIDNKPTEIDNKSAEIDNESTEEIQAETNEDTIENSQNEAQIEPQDDIQQEEIKHTHELQREVETIHFSDEELDFFNIAKKSASENFNDALEDSENNLNLSLNNEDISNSDSVLIDNVEYKTQNDVQDNKKKEELEASNEEEDDDDLDLSEVANNSIDESFEQIINEKAKDSKPTIDLGNDVQIEEEPTIASNTDDTLPIFKETVPEAKNDGEEYSTGDIIIHKKYGKGKIIKTIKYEHRQLLQIEFEESGKKLLDPAVADIKLEQ